jgi:hypothetical protein
VEIVIPPRFCGPPESGNGGWVSGSLARHVVTGPERPAVTVRLASPPPLERPLRLVEHRDAEPPGIWLLDGDHLVAAAASASDVDGDVPGTATWAQAADAERRFEGLAGHPFPTCFSCGTAREAGDGLCLRPGPLDDGTGRYATTWVPSEVDLPTVWAALDCPGGWSAGIAGRPMVLGTMTARVHELPAAGEPHVVLAWARGASGRKHLSGTALLRTDGRVLARAAATWIAVDPSSVRPKEPA